jgi:hypothetical protein
MQQTAKTVRDCAKPYENHMIVKISAIVDAVMTAGACVAWL